MKNKAIIIIFLSFIYGLGILHVVVKDESFSEHENRMLASYPSFSLEKYFSGKYTEQFETYVTDQFFAKPFWLATKTVTEKALGKQENNGIYFSDHGYLLEKYDLHEDTIIKNINYINNFADSQKNVSSYLLLVPNSISIYPEYLPDFSPTDSQLEALSLVESTLSDSITYVESYESLLNKKDESIYFKTDHHWTMRGAYYAYLEVAKAMGFEPLEIEEFDKQMISNNFFGTYYSKVNDFLLEPDTIEQFISKNNVDVKVTYESKEQADTLYNSEYLNKKDKYSYFLDGNHSLVKINTSVKNGKKIAVIKDSYAHVFIPFLVHHFEEIHVVDLRYFHQNVNEYVQEHELSTVLFLYNVSNFTSDNHLVWLTYGAR
ncbi:DHHW family protein [Bacillaceae bacterium W0354]